MVRHRVMPVWTVFLHQTGEQAEDVITIEYNDFLMDRRVERDVRQACLRFLAARRQVGGRRVGELAFCGLHEARADDLRRLNRPLRELASTGSARLDLAAIRHAGKSYQDSLKPSTARRIRRSLALYRARGEIETAAAGTVADALGFFHAAGALHQQRWTAKGHPGAFAYPFYVAFHERLISAALPLGQVELVRVSVAGEPLGYLYNFLYGKSVCYYFSGFRFEADNRLKPGLVCHQLCIERHLAGPMEIYDFMGGEQRYKTELGQPGPRIVALAVQRPSLLLAAERPLRRLKQALEPGQTA
jgi:CelD/BcsL family acetyltransferase involved in cellulose biosynthesis